MMLVCPPKLTFSSSYSPSRIAPHEKLSSAHIPPSAAEVVPTFLFAPLPDVIPAPTTGDSAATATAGSTVSPSVPLTVADDGSGWKPSISGAGANKGVAGGGSGGGGGGSRGDTVPPLCLATTNDSVVAEFWNDSELAGIEVKDGGGGGVALPTTPDTTGSAEGAPQAIGTALLGFDGGVLSASWSSLLGRIDGGVRGSTGGSLSSGGRSGLGLVPAATNDGDGGGGGKLTTALGGASRETGIQVNLASIGVSAVP